jgi:hypothetical protein
LIHAVLIALADDGDDKVHKYDVADDQNEEPEEPCEDFEVFGALNDGRGVVVTDGLTQHNHKKCRELDPIVPFPRFLDNDLGHHGEAPYHEKEIEEKDKELFEYNYQHSYQEADLSPDSYQKAELDET